MITLVSQSTTNLGSVLSSDGLWEIVEGRTFLIGQFCFSVFSPRPCVLSLVLMNSTDGANQFRPFRALFVAHVLGFRTLLGELYPRSIYSLRPLE